MFFGRRRPSARGRSRQRFVHVGGPRAPRQSLRDRAAADARRRSGPGPGPGHVFEGVSRPRSFRGRDQPEGVAVHDPAQHLAQSPAGSGPVAGGVRLGGRRAGARVARAVSSPRVESPETLLLRASFDAELKAALDALPETFRAAVWLRDVEEMSYQEIAASAGDSDRHGDVAHLARPAAVARSAGAGASRSRGRVGLGGAASERTRIG